MLNARLDEAQAGIKIARRNINNLRYRDDTTLMADSEEELKRHKLESRLPGEISITSDTEMTPPLWQTVKRN